MAALPSEVTTGTDGNAGTQVGPEMCRAAVASHCLLFTAACSCWLDLSSRQWLGPGVVSSMVWGSSRGATPGGFG